MESTEKVIVRDYSRRDYTATLVKEDGSSFHATLIENEQGLFAKASSAILPLRGNTKRLEEINNDDTFDILEAIVNTEIP